MSKRDISLKRAYDILRQCAGVLLEERYIEPTLFDLEDDGNNTWMNIHWTEIYNGEEVYIVVSFIEDDNRTVILEGGVMTLVNSDGEEEELTLLREFIPED
jgi:hypothetical protein